MITRVWHGRTKHLHADNYLAFLLEEGTKEYLHTEGNLGVKVLRKKDERSCHFWTVTEWKDPEALKSFAGEDYEKAKYYPEDKGMLLEFEETVNHYECFDVSALKVKEYVRQLEQLYHGGSWQGESFDEKLKDVNEAQAFAEPVSGVHSIAEIVWHCIYWRTVLIKRLEENQQYRDETVAQQNFRPVNELKQIGWAAIKQTFEETQATLIQQLREHNDRFLKKQYQSGYTFDYHFEGIIQHDVYHLGQIGLVKKILSLNLIPEA